MVGQTLLDVVAILNLLIHGEDLVSLYGTYFSTTTTSLGIQFSKDDFRYSKFMHLNSKKSGLVLPDKLHAFF